MLRPSPRKLYRVAKIPQRDTRYTQGITNMLQELRFIIGTLILSIGAYNDLKTRKAPDRLWIFLGGIGFFFLVYELSINGIDYMRIFITIGLLLLFYLFFQIGLIKGGADTKALFALSLLIGIYVFDVFIIAVCLMLFSCICMYLYKKGSSFRSIFVEYKYPFLMPLCLSFVLSYVFTNGWNTSLFEGV